MKRSQVFPSTFLGKDDVPHPIRAVIRDVVVQKVKSEHGEEDKPVMLFTDEVLKPMILNNTNWAVCEAYGDDSDLWRGHPVEIYLDPNIMFGSKRVGGLRLRLPVAGGIANGHRPPATPEAPPAPLPSLAQRHAQAMQGISGATTTANLEQWATWAKGFPFGPTQKEQLETAYRGSLERLSPVPVNQDADLPPPPMSGDDIPF